MKLVVLTLLAVLISALPVQANSKWRGDDPFPLSCINFSGDWRSDDGRRTNVSQRGCEYLLVEVVGVNGESALFSVIPDDKNRVVREGRYKGTIRHRWNTTSYGTVIESSSTMVSSSGQITERAYLELIERDLLLESGYRVTENYRTGKIAKEKYDIVYRRASYR